MKRIKATLPVIGKINIDFHSESEEILNYFGEKELNRLDNISHLGVASSVFTGIKHTRYEYMLLQCAIINLIAKLHKHHELFGISSRVSLDGLTRPISSGEELLKIWAILGNYGHTQYTYGVERSILQFSRISNNFKKWFLSDLNNIGMKAWANNVINSYQDYNMHYVIALKRINMIPKKDRIKRRLIYYLRNLLLPIPNIYRNNREFQYKVGKFRELFGIIRLLSMITIDAYYSHLPLRYQLMSAISNLFIVDESEGVAMKNIMTNIAAWLADEIYLHPKAVAAQRYYELKSIENIRAVSKVGIRKKHFMNNILSNGFGKPRKSPLIPLLRIKFDQMPQYLLGKKDIYNTLIEFESKIVNNKTIFISVDRNHHNDAVYIDLLYSRKATLSEVKDTYYSLYIWMIRQLKADILKILRRIDNNIKENNRMYLSFFENRLSDQIKIIHEYFYSLIKYIIGDMYTIEIKRLYSQHTTDNLLYQIKDLDNNVYGNINQNMVEITQFLKNNQMKDDLQEVECLKHFIKNKNPNLLIISPESIVIRDSHGRTKDQWDASVCEFENNKIKISIIEAKNTRHPRQNENEAFKQLLETRKIVKKMHDVKTSRRRIPRLGAVLTLNLE